MGARTECFRCGREVTVTYSNRGKERIHTHNCPHGRRCVRSSAAVTACAECDGPMPADAIVKRCSCGRTYTADAWRQLPDAKRYDFENETHEQRQCSCRSHIIVVLKSDGAPTRIGRTLGVA